MQVSHGTLWLSHMADRKSGVVAWWDDERGQGRIKGPDGKSLYCNYTDIRKRNVLYPGQTVTYVEILDPMLANGSRATKVKVEWS